METTKSIRLSDREIKALKKAILQKDAASKIYLFGSRTQSDKRGGDIDILILSDHLTQKDLRQIRIGFMQQFGEQKLDLLLDTPQMQKPFTRIIYPKSVPL